MEQLTKVKVIAFGISLVVLMISVVLEKLREGTISYIVPGISMILPIAMVSFVYSQVEESVTVEQIRLFHSHSFDRVTMGTVVMIYIFNPDVSFFNKFYLLPWILNFVIAHFGLSAMNDPD